MAEDLYLVTERELQSATVNAAGELEFTRENGQKINAGKVRGDITPEAIAARDAAVAAKNDAVAAKNAAQAVGTTNDTIMTNVAKDPGSQFATQLSASIAGIGDVKYAPMRCLYEPSSTALLKWRTTRAAVLAGVRQGHIAVVGDSIAFGAAATGTSNPKHLSSWPGRLRAALAKRYGEAGSGIVIANRDVLATPAYDPRWAFGPNVTNIGFGFHKWACLRIDAVAGTYVEFTARAEKFVIYNFNDSGGANVAKVDGAEVGKFANTTNPAAGVTLSKRTGYHTGQIVTEVPAGAVGSHTLRVEPDATNANWDIFLAGVEALIPTPGTFRVSNPSISGKALSSLYGSTSDPTNNDETGGLYGLPMIDMLKADLLVIALGINDFQGGSTTAVIKSRLVGLIQRQRASGANAGGGSKPAGEAVLLLNPKPDTSVITSPIGVTWEQYRAAAYEVAAEQNVALIDLGYRWEDFATANSLGLYGDGIHPNDTGSLDIATAVDQALFSYA